jgi:hypothetical protein
VQLCGARVVHAAAATVFAPCGLRCAFYSGERGESVSETERR